MRRWLTIAAWIACGAVTSVALARPNASDTSVARDEGRGPGARSLSRKSASAGYPWQGRLKNGVKVTESEYLRYTGEYAKGGNFYGTWELVQLLERAAYRVWRKHPGAKLSIGELSASRGGMIGGHNSHRNGRDADIAFYMLDAAGKPVSPFGFATFDANGMARAPNAGLRFDDARNWELVSRLVTDGEARVQYLFVANALKERLLREGAKRGASTSVLARAREVMVQPKGTNPHRNHFHVRIYCPPGDRPSCRDRAPFHAWYPGTPPGGPRLTAPEVTEEAELVLPARNRAVR